MVSLCVGDFDFQYLWVSLFNLSIKPTEPSTREDFLSWPIAQGDAVCATQFSNGNNESNSIYLIICVSYFLCDVISILFES